MLFYTHATYRWAFVSRSGTAMAHTASATTTQHLQGIAIALPSAEITQLLGGRVFSRDVVLFFFGGGGGGNCFCGERKCKKYPKNKQNLLLFRGEIQNLGGKVSPPKGPEKTLLGGYMQHSC